MRRKLLGGLSEDNQRSKRSKLNTGNEDEAENSDDDISDRAQDELEVNFGVGFGEDIGKKLIHKKQERKEK